MTDFGRRVGTGDMTKAVYDPIIDALLALAAAHKTQHQDAGSDQITVAGLLGELAEAQPSTWAKVAGKPTTFAPAAHKTSHQLGGADVLSLAGLTPGLHKLTHKLGGSDPIDVTGLPGAGGAALQVDGTVGRVLRFSTLTITYGAQADTLKCTLGARFNGDAIALTDNIAKGQTTGHYTLDANGVFLTIEAAGLTGNVVAAFAMVYINQCQTDLTPYSNAVSNDILLKCTKTLDGTDIDLTAAAQAGHIYLYVLYITDA